MATEGRGWAIGLDMGGTKCLGVLVDPDGNVRATHRVPTPEGTEAVLAALTGTAEILRRQSPGDVTTIGCGVPGLVTRSGELRYAPHLPGVTDFPLGAELSERLGIVTVVENDNTCATAAEASARPSTESLLYVGFGTGIGGGLVINGRLERGHHGFAGEFGHLVVIIGGEQCVCGRRGCWERYASGDALGRLGAAVGIVGEGEGVRRLLRQGDNAASSVIERFSDFVAVGLVNLVLSFDPEVVVVGGGAIGQPEQAEELLAPIRRRFEAEFGNAAGHRSLPAIEPARFGPEAAAMGAALLSAGDGPVHAISTAEASEVRRRPHVG